MEKNKYINIEIKGIEELNNKLDNLLENVQSGLYNGIQFATNTTQELSILLVKANSGNLRNSIEKLVGLNGDEVFGKVYVDLARVPYALYVYYGTGIYNNLGIFTKSWTVPVEKVDSSKAGKYNWKVNKGSNGKSDYYIIQGQHANPFLMDAYQSSFELNMNTIKEEVKSAILRGI